MRRSFRLAGSSQGDRILSLSLGGTLLALVAASPSGVLPLTFAAGLAGVLLAERTAAPRRFEADAGTFDVLSVWGRRSIGDVTRARRCDAKEMRERYGWPIPIGRDGWWSAVRRLAVESHPVEFYTTRDDGLVLIEREGGNAIVVTPDDPDGLVAVLNGVRESRSQ